MLEHFRSYRTALNNTAVLSKVSSEDCDSACFAVGIVNRTDNIVIFVYAACDIFGNSFACAGHNVGVEQIFLVKLVHNCVNSACFVKILHISVTCGSKVAEVRSLCAYLICDIEIYFNSALVSDSGEVEHTVGGAAQSHINGKSIVKCLFGHDIKWSDVLSVKLHYLHTCVLCKAQSFGINSGDSTVALEAHAQNFGKAVHGVCSVHTRAASAGGTSLVLKLFKLFLVYSACGVCAYSLEHTGK